MEGPWGMSYETLLAVLVLLFVLIKYLLRKLTVGDYDRKYVLITGCDTGFGNLLAKRLDSMGFNVFAGCLTEKGVSELKSKSSKRLEPILLDITKSKDIERTENIVKKELPPNRGLWALINNAGIMGQMMFPDCIDVEHYKKLLDVNLFGTIQMTHTFLPLLRLAQGRIVNVGSVLGRTSVRLCVPYCISKHAVTAYSDGLRRAIRSQNVSVHLLEPGAFATNLIEPDHMLKTSYKVFNEAPQSLQDYYGKKCLEDFILCAQGMQKTDPALHKVIDCHVHAITARFPKYNYPVGNDAWFKFLPLRLLPSWISDVLMDTESVPPIGASTEKNN